MKGGNTGGRFWDSRLGNNNGALDFGTSRWSLIDWRGTTLLGRGQVAVVVRSLVVGRSAGDMPTVESAVNGGTADCRNTSQRVGGCVARSIKLRPELERPVRELARELARSSCRG